MFGRFNGYTNLGLFQALHQDGIAVPEQEIQKARENDPEALYIIADIYYNYKHYEKAFAWFLKAALQDYADAQAQLGYMYQWAKGVSRDYEQAMDWNMKAASTGNAKGQYNIGVLYYRGHGVSLDDKQAMDWYLKAASNGNTDAMNEIGLMYCKGEGVTKNIPTAIEWYIKAAKQGDTRSQYRLGNIYEYEDEVKDIQQAVNWYQKSANNGYWPGNAQVDFLGKQGYYAKEDAQEEKDENEIIQGDETINSINNDQSQSSTTSINGEGFNKSVESRVDNLEKMFQSMMSLMKVNNDALQKELDALKKKERQQNEENKTLKERLARMEAEMQENPNNDLNYDSPDDDDIE